MLEIAILDMVVQILIDENQSSSYGSQVPYKIFNDRIS